MNKLELELDEAFVHLRVAIAGLFTAQEANLEAKVALEDAQRAILISHADDPKKLGSNEAARQAKLDELCSKELEASRSAAERLRMKQHELELARLDWEKFRQMKHLAAISAGVSLN